MNELLKILLSLSLSGALLVIVLFLCKPLVKGRLSKQWQYYIWLIVIGRLLIPFAPETSLVGSLFQRFDNAAIQPDTTSQQELRGPLLSEADPSENDIPADNQAGIADGGLTEPEKPLVQGLVNAAAQNVWLVCWLVWLMVAIALLIRKITLYQSFVKYVKAGQIEISDLAHWEQVGRLLEQVGVKRAVGLYTNSLISSPLLIGFFRPCIMLPTTELSDSAFEVTILHELTHFKRRDMFYKWLVQITICIHWFNPLAYAMGREVSRACELSCDEAVVSALDPQKRRAYGDTLLNAMGSGGSYKGSLASVTLSEGKELLKERLDAIMGFKKKTRFTAAISIVLVCAFCFGATVAGAYTVPLLAGKGACVNKPEQQVASIPSSAIDGSLTLVRKEYALADIKSLNISGIVVEAFSENVSVARGGETLQVEYYIQNQDDYTLQNESDAGGTFEELVLRRTSPATAGDAARHISITIPDNINFKLTSVTTSSGKIILKNCSGENVFSKTQSGDIIVNGGFASNMFKVETGSGNAVISDTDFPAKKYGINFETNSGTITFQPKDNVQNYCFAIDTGAGAQVTVNGKKYDGGDYEINANTTKRIYFDSPNGSFIVQDFSWAKLPIKALEPLVVSARVEHLTQDVNSNLTLVKKEYTVNDLEQLGISGIFVKALGENIVVNQGGSSLIIEYVQADGTDYTLGTRNYEFYYGDFSTPEDIAMYGGISGTVKQIDLRRESPATALDTVRTINITLPADPKYSRAVQLMSDSGDIQLNQCSSTAMLDAMTQSGNISVQNCSSPQLGVKSHSGNIDISGCSMKKLDSSVIRGGTMSLQLADRVENYRISIDTEVETQIAINGKNYPGGEFILNKNAASDIGFDSYGNGSLVITDMAK